MLYTLIKWPIRIALQAYLGSINVRGKSALTTKGPLLLVANHPNSFLDAIIIAASCRYPVHFLARGDAFRKPWHNTLLRLLNMIPVYRLSEGRENLHLNEKAFAASKAILQLNGIVLIFIEGVSVNSHQLQPFRKGAARIARDVVNSGVPLQVLPISISYAHFHGPHKSVWLSAGEIQTAISLLPGVNEAQQLNYFNEQLCTQLTDLFIQPQEPAPKTPVASALTFAAKILHAPLYGWLAPLIDRKTKGTVFYDSVLFGALLLVYPGYLLLILLLLSLFQLPVSCIILFPLMALLASKAK